MQDMIGDIQKQHLLPRQKEAFLCCAKCCDVSSDLQQLQGWWGRTSPSHACDDMQTPCAHSQCRTLLSSFCSVAAADSDDDA